MYQESDEDSYEYELELECMYDSNHISEVLNRIEKNFASYFDKYVETKAGTSNHKRIQELSKKLTGSTATITNKEKNKEEKKSILDDITKKAIEDFEQDRKSYLNLLSLEGLEEYECDPSGFKVRLRNDCPIIRKTLQSRKRNLRKYKASFQRADPGELLRVVTSIVEFEKEYKNNYVREEYNNAKKVEDLEFSNLVNDDKYYVQGVIGGGIQSHFLWKLSPHIFPYRGRTAIWPLYYLVGQEPLDCKQASEFLWIDTQKNITKHNYYYPYDLFGFYALKLFQIIEERYKEYNISVQNDYRYVILNSFLTFVYEQHNNEIEELEKDFSEIDY